ncbi:MAG: PQQ-dependent dehydrogenase, methanol/ethanol family [Polyangiales bacterium]
MSKLRLPFVRVCPGFLLLVAAAGLLAWPAAGFAQPAAERLQTTNTATITKPHADDWPSYGLDYREQRFSPLEKINRENVSTLGLAWHFDADYARGIEATPIVVDGIMYVTGSWSVLYALDAKTGQLLWKFDPQVPKAVGASTCCDVVNRGVAVYEGKVFLGALDTRLFALDAKTGAKVWEVLTADRGKGDYTVTGAPRVANGRVFIGNGGAEFGVRGYVSAYSVESGELLWRFFTVPGNPADGPEDEVQERAAKTWTGEWWKAGGGGTVWDSIVYDPELDRLYIGTGNGSPWHRGQRSPNGGDNLFLSSVVALEPATGKYIWHYQEVPGETWDYTATQTIMLAEMPWEGSTRKVLWHAPKSGFFYIIDRTDGKLLSAEPYSRQNWAKGYDLKSGRPIFNPEADWTQTDKAVTIIPGHGGAHNWPPMAYSPVTRLVYIPEQEYPIQYQRRDRTGTRHNVFDVGTQLTSPTPDSPLLLEAFTHEALKSNLLAWDPFNQKVAFRIPQPAIGGGGILATAGGLVFQGVEGDDALVAYDAQNGNRLWSYDTQEVPVAAPVSYAVDGEQYIAVGVGRGGTMGLMAASQKKLPPNGRFVAFKLGAKAALPAASVEVSYGDPPAPTDQQRDIAASGEELFRANCVRCHGLKGASNRRVPDLRRLPRAYYDTFESIVLDGSADAAGMPGFRHALSPEQAAAIKAYLLVEADIDRNLRTQPEWWLDAKRTWYRLLAKVLVPLM